MARLFSKKIFFQHSVSFSYKNKKSIASYSLVQWIIEFPMGWISFRRVGPSNFFDPLAIYWFQLIFYIRPLMPCLIAVVQHYLLEYIAELENASCVPQSLPWSETQTNPGMTGILPFPSRLVFFGHHHHNGMRHQVWRVLLVQAYLRQGLSGFVFLTTKDTKAWNKSRTDCTSTIAGVHWMNSHRQ